MDFIYGYIDRIIEKYATKHKDELLNKRAIKDFLEQHDEDYMRWAAYSALIDTPLDVGRDNYNQPAYSRIPPELLISLKRGTFPDNKIAGISRQKREKIQRMFDKGGEAKDSQGRTLYYGGYEGLVDSGFHQKAEAYLKARWTTAAVILAIIIAAAGFCGHAYLKAKADAKYWATYNTPQTYTGDGFTENFPCGQVQPEDPFLSPDLSSKTYKCEYFGGSDHTQIDIYSVEAEHFLTNKYDPASLVACGDPMHYTGSADTQVYYNETRQVDGFTWVICGVGQDPMVARLQNGNTVYTLQALPHTEKNTAADLDTLIRGFQLN